MTTPKDAIKEVLVSLDLADDKNWTEDGSPALDVIQKLTNDPTVTRAQINDAFPGFARVSADQAAKTYTPPAASEPAKVSRPRKPADITETPLTDEQMRAICDRRVREAEASLLEAQQRVSDATLEVAQCQKRLGNAHRDHDRHFPRITAAANIKAHLEAQGRLAEENAGLISPLQATLMNRKRPVAGQVNSQAAPLLPRRSAA